MLQKERNSPIGIFDSGYGGLTVFKEIVELLPEYDYIYLGDNARTPYGTRSFETIYQYTWQCVEQLFAMGCRLVILACNTASAKALRTIQQKRLPELDFHAKVLGVIRPTTEILGNLSTTKKVGILATQGTVSADSYRMELEKFFPELEAFQQACPMWVPIVEQNEMNTDGAAFFVKRDLDLLFAQSKEIDTLVLACTHYPLLINQIKNVIPEAINVLSQGNLVAKSLVDYLNRHPEIEHILAKSGNRTFYTTDDPKSFNKMGAIFYGKEVNSKHLDLK